MVHVCALYPVAYDGVSYSKGQTFYMDFGAAAMAVRWNMVKKID